MQGFDNSLEEVLKEINDIEQKNSPMKS